MDKTSQHLVGGYLEVLGCEPDVGDQLGAVGEDAVHHLAALVRGVLHVVLLLLLTLQPISQRINFKTRMFGSLKESHSVMTIGGIIAKPINFIFSSSLRSITCSYMNNYVHISPSMLRVPIRN